MSRRTLPMSRKQLRSIAQSTARINLWHGAIRSGKTVASLLAFLGAVASAPAGALILITGRTLESIERNIIKPLQDPAKFGTMAHCRHTRGTTVARILGHTVDLVGASDNTAEFRIRGATAFLAYVDEATLLPESFWIQLLGRLSEKGARLFATTNPGAPRHWLKLNYLDRQHELDMRSWHFRLDDNPSLDPGYKRSIQAEYQGLWRRRMIDGAWVMAEGAIYDMWDESRHVVKTIPQISRYLAMAIDHGTTNPFVALVIGLGVDGRLYVTAEWRHDSKAAHRSMTDAEYDVAVRAWLRKQRVSPELTIIDPSAASFIEQMYRSGQPGLTLADNAVDDGIRVLASLLACGQIAVHESCEGLIGELVGYSWDPKASEIGEDAPLKIDDHGPDALRYGTKTTEYLWRPSIITPDMLEVAA